MEWILPGTVLALPREKAENIEAVFEPMFLTGGMMLGNVAAMTGLEPYIIQNWVRRGFLSPPKGRCYTLRQLCRVLNINMLRSVLPMEQICGMLTYINGVLDDEGDDLIDDSRLYFMFVRLSARGRVLADEAARLAAVREEAASYEEPVPGARERIEKVLNIMLVGYFTARMKEETESLLRALSEAEA